MGMALLRHFHLYHFVPSRHSSLTNSSFAALFEASTPSRTATLTPGRKDTRRWSDKSRFEYGHRHSLTERCYQGLPLDCPSFLTASVAVGIHLRSKRFADSLNLEWNDSVKAAHWRIASHCFHRFLLLLISAWPDFSDYSYQPLPERCWCCTDQKPRHTHRHLWITWIITLLIAVAPDSRFALDISYRSEIF